MAASEDSIEPVASILFPGFVFRPYPETLVEYYLRNFAAGIHVGPGTGRGFVWECDEVFSTPPEVLTTIYPAAKPDDCWFFLTHRKPRARAVPNAGSWRVYRAKRAVVASGGTKVAGAYHQNLEYMVGDKKNAGRTGWLMEEFGLDGGCGSDRLEPVLCTLHLSARTIKKRPLPEESSSSSPIQASKKARFEEFSGVLEMGAEPAVLPSPALESSTDTAGLEYGQDIDLDNLDFDALFGNLDWTADDLTEAPIISPPEFVFAAPDDT